MPNSIIPAKKPTFGNKCGHDPENPLPFLRPNGHKQKPILIERALRKAASYFKYSEMMLQRLNPSLRASLNFAKKFKMPLQLKMRKIRSEKCEALQLTIQALLYYMDKNSHEISIKNQNGVKALSLKDIAELAGLSFSRVKRSIRALKEAGYLVTVKRRSKRVNGRFIAYAAIRKFTKQFFKDLGLKLNKQNPSEIVTRSTKPQLAIDNEILAKAQAIWDEGPKTSIRELLKKLNSPPNKATA